MPLLTLAGFTGANTKVHRRFLAESLGVASLNQKPSEEGDFRPWRVPLDITGPVIPSGRMTLYRMNADVASSTNHWLSWTTFVHVTRAFDGSDTSERTYFTGSGTPKWADNLTGLATPPFPTATRELAVPQPTAAPLVTLGTDGPSGDARRLYYVYTRVNDIGWESAPSPPYLAPAAKPGATLNLSYSEPVPVGNYGVNRVRWYRTQEVGTTENAEFFFLREYLIGASGQQDDARDLGEQLATETWISLDANASWLTYCWNQFAACLVGQAVRFCEPETIYAWPLEYEYPVASTPIALAAFAQRLVVLTSIGAEVLTGQDPSGMDQKPLPLAVCIAPRSVVVGDTFMVWASADGLWMYDVSGVPRNLVEGCLTRAQWAALVPSTIAGFRYQLGERFLYVGFYNDGALKGFVVDPSNPNGVYFLSTGYPAGYYDKLTRKLFVLDGSTLREWDAGAEFMTASFTSRVARQNEHAEPEWLELLSTGSVTVQVYTENQAAPEAALVERVNRSLTTGLHRLPDGIGGRDFQMRIVTQGSVQGLAIE